MTQLIDDDVRKQHELIHGRKLLAHNAAEIWGHTSLAGQRRVLRRIQIMADLIKPNSSTRMVELGCGLGIFSKELAKTEAQIIAIDISPDLLNAARARIKVSNVNFIEGDCMKLEDISCLQNTDAVVGNSILHHLNIVKALNSIYKVLKPGGRIIFFEPNMLNPQILLQKNIPWLKRLAGDSPDETAFFRRSLKHLLIKSGFTNDSVTPFDFLHPSTPTFFVDALEKIGKIMEKVPVIKEISGSLLITAVKPLV